MLHTFKVMYVTGICPKNMSIESNYFIKDLGLKPTMNVSYWEYNINGIKYFVPNFGFLLLFDSSYSDIDDDKKFYNSITEKFGEDYAGLKPEILEKLQSFIKNNDYIDIDAFNAYVDSLKVVDVSPFTQQDLKNVARDLANRGYEHKTLMKVFYKNNYFEGGEFYSNPNLEEIRGLLKEEIKKMLNGFESLIKTDNNVIQKPSDDILQIIADIKDNINFIDGDELFIRFFGEYLHNRVGTPLKQKEVKHINHYVSDFNKGELVAVRIAHNYYEWGVYLGPSTKRNQIDIIHRDPSTMEKVGKIKSFYKGALNKFPTSLSLEQEVMGGNMIAAPLQVLERYELNDDIVKK